MKTIFLANLLVGTRRQTVTGKIQRSVYGLYYSLRRAGQQNNIEAFLGKRQFYRVKPESGTVQSTFAHAKQDPGSTR